MILCIVLSRSRLDFFFAMIKAQQILVYKQEKTFIFQIQNFMNRVARKNITFTFFKK